MNRKPPAEVRRALRNENGYLCIIENCSVPFLEYHHFDPLWKDQQHHNPSGMVAMCPTHHRQADGGAWTKEQFIEMKQRVAQHKTVKGRFEYMRKKILLVTGSSYYFDNRNAEIQVGEFLRIWFEKDEIGCKLLNVVIPDESGKGVQIIEDNVWNASRLVKDIECPPSGKELEIRFNEKDRLYIRFRDIDDMTVFEEYYRSTNPVVSDEMMNHLPFTVLEVELKIDSAKLEFSPGKAVVGQIRFPTNMIAGFNGIGVFASG